MKRLDGSFEEFVQFFIDRLNTIGNGENKPEVNILLRSRVTDNFVVSGYEPSLSSKVSFLNPMSLKQAIKSRSLDNFFSIGFTDTLMRAFYGESEGYEIAVDFDFKDSISLYYSLDVGERIVSNSVYPSELVEKLVQDATIPVDFIL